MRDLIDSVATIPGTGAVQIQLCQESIEWCKEEKRTFLRQRIETKLASLCVLQRTLAASAHAAHARCALLPGW